MSTTMLHLLQKLKLSRASAQETLTVCCCMRRATLQHCTLLNVSVCTASVQSSAAGTGFQLLLYNSLAWERTEPVQVPLTGAHAWSVTGVMLKMETTRTRPQPESDIVASECPSRHVGDPCSVSDSYRLQHVG